MNYLAHFHLARHSDTSVSGGMLGDFVKGETYRKYSPRLQLGILLHRHVDSYTDQHPQVKAAQQLLVSTPSRVRGIAVDMLFDHLLACHWRHYQTTSLDRFAIQVYRRLAHNRHAMPPAAARVARLMAEGNWLTTYRSTEGLAQALRGISGRLKHRFALTNAVQDLQLEQQALEAHFHGFYRELLEQLPVLTEVALSRVHTDTR